MSFNTRIKSLESAINRLEVRMGKGRQCALCRLEFRHRLPGSPKRPQSEHVIRAKCEFCFIQYTINLEGFSEEDREASRLFHYFTLEDQYTNPKAHAFILWLNFRPQLRKFLEQSDRASIRVNNNPNARFLAKLREEARQLHQQKRKKLKAKYGDRPFPEHMQIVEAVKKRQHNKVKPGVYVHGLSELEQEETGHLICAELEKIIWGQTIAGTASAISRVQREIEDLTRPSEEVKEPPKEEAVDLAWEEARLRNLERINRNRAKFKKPPLPDDYGKR